jgi:hypothetical protein
MTERMAIAMASYITIRMLQNFSSVERMDSRAWTEKLGLSLASENGVYLAFS